jgi:hypothetical protein
VSWLKWQVAIDQGENFKADYLHCIFKNFINNILKIYDPQTIKQCWKHYNILYVVEKQERIEISLESLEEYLNEPTLNSLLELYFQKLVCRVSTYIYENKRAVFVHENKKTLCIKNAEIPKVRREGFLSV